jgi:hypothetical protein
LDRLQTRFAAGAAGFLKGFSAVVFPRLMPPAHRLTMNPQSTGHLRLAQTLVKKFDGFESSLLQLLEIAFDSFAVSHDSKTNTGTNIIPISERRAGFCHARKRAYVTAAGG